MDPIAKTGFSLGLLTGILVTVVFILVRRPVEKVVDSIIGLLPIGIRKLYLYPKWKNRYLTMLIGEHQYLRFVGVRWPTSLRRPRLSDVYVNLELQSTMWVARSESTSSTLGLGQIYSLDTAIEKYHHMVILGGPGSGKTTLLEHLACVYGAGQTRRIRLFPIYVPLRRCTFRGKSLIEQLTDPSTGLISPDLLRTYPARFFESQLNIGRCILLFDGLDEVLNEEDHVAAARMVNTTAALYPSCTIVVTSRLAGWRDLLGQNFSRLVIRDLSRKEIAGLVSQWHRAVIRGELEAGHGGQISDEQADRAHKSADEKADQMMAVLKVTPRLMQIASTPLVLSLMCLVFYTRHDLPRRRAKLYEECTAILLDVWDSLDKQLSYADSPRYEDRIRLIETVATYLFDNKSTEIARVDAERIVQTVLPTASMSSSRILQLIEQRSGILSEKAFDILGFTHLTFQEFYAAKALASSPNGLPKLLQHFNDTEGEEVLLLYSGIIPDATQLISDLLRMYDAGARVYALVAAGRVAIEATRLAIETKSEVTALLTSHFDSETDQSTLLQIQSILAELGIDKQIVREFGDYDILHELGRGANGTVYAAIDRVNVLFVAIKIYNVTSENIIKFIIKGIKQLLRINHDNIIKYIGIGSHQSQLFVTMEYINGFSLDDFLEQKPATLAADVTLQVAHSPLSRLSLDTPVAIAAASQPGPSAQPGPSKFTIPMLLSQAYYSLVKRIMLNVLAGVDHLHEQGVIHGDIKPSNIMWDGNQAKIGDYGIDTLIAAGRSLSRDTMTFRRNSVGPLTVQPIQHLFTPAFAAPEVLQSYICDISSDIYSIGCVLRFLCGIPPTDTSIHEQALHSSLSPSQDAIAIMRRSLCRNPQERYQNCKLMISAIESANLCPAHVR